MFIVSAIKPKHIQTINVKNESKKGDKKHQEKFNGDRLGCQYFFLFYHVERKIKAKKMNEICANIICTSSNLIILCT